MCSIWIPSGFIPSGFIPSICIKKKILIFIHIAYSRFVRATRLIKFDHGCSKDKLELVRRVWQTWTVRSLLPAGRMAKVWARSGRQNYLANARPTAWPLNKSEMLFSYIFYDIAFWIYDRQKWPQPPQPSVHFFFFFFIIHIVFLVCYYKYRRSGSTGNLISLKNIYETVQSETHIKNRRKQNVYNIGT